MSPVTVKAVVVEGQDREPSIVDVCLPPVGPNDVRVEIAYAGVCHSDLSMTNGTIAADYPLVLGHEASGVVVEAGTAVVDLTVGSPVVLNWAAPCRSCWFCLRGQSWLCQKVEGVVTRPGGNLAASGELVNLALGVGAFAEQTVVPRNSVVPISQTIPLDQAALLGCAVLTGVGAVQNTSRVQQGDTVAVFGLGGIGLSAVAGARMAGAAQIIAVDVSDEKAQVASEMGATDFITYESRIAKPIRSLTDGLGVDHAFECVGKAETIRAAWSSTRRGGTCTVVGVGRASEQVVFNPMELYHFARTLTSSVFGSCDPDRDVPMLCDSMLAGHLDLHPLISSQAGLAGIHDAFERMRVGQGVRSLLQPNETRVTV